MRNASCWWCAVVVLVSASCALAQDWPQWRGPNRDGKVTAFTAPAAWPKTLTQKWKVEVGSGDSTPALVGDKLYVFARQGGDEVTLCLSVADGKEVWKDKFAVAAISGAAARAHAGPRSSPAVSDGKVVTLGVSGVVTCLDAASGKVLWRNEEYKGAPKFFTAMSPLIVDGMAILQLGGDGKGTTVAFDLADGKAKWKSDGDGPSYASPALLTAEGVKQIVTLTEKAVVGISLGDGKLLWQIPFAPQGMTYNAATPIVDGATVIFTGQGRGIKAVKIEKDGDAFKPKELWSNAQVATKFNTPVLKDGFLYGFTDQGSLFCINAQDGKTAWTDSIKYGGGRDAGYGEIVDAGDVMLALPSTGELIAFKPDSKQYSELAKIKVADSATYAFPVVSGNRVFIKDQQSLMLLTIE